MMRHILLLLIVTLAPTAVAAPQGDKPLKIFLHWDMEGTSGLFPREQVWYWEKGVRPEMAQEGRERGIPPACLVARLGRLQDQRAERG